MKEKGKQLKVTFEFELLTGTCSWSQLGHSVSCLITLLSMFGNHKTSGLKYNEWAVSPVVSVRTFGVMCDHTPFRAWNHQTSGLKYSEWAVSPVITDSHVNLPQGFE